MLILVVMLVVLIILLYKFMTNKTSQIIVDPAAPYKKNPLPMNSYVLKQGVMNSSLLTKKDTEETKEPTERLSREDLLKLACPYENSEYWEGCRSQYVLNAMKPIDRVRTMMNSFL